MLVRETMDGGRSWHRSSNLMVHPPPYVPSFRGLRFRLAENLSVCSLQTLPDMKSKDLNPKDRPSTHGNAAPTHSRSCEYLPASSANKRFRDAVSYNRADRSLASNLVFCSLGCCRCHGHPVSAASTADRRSPRRPRPHPQARPPTCPASSRSPLLSLPRPRHHHRRQRHAEERSVLAAVVPRPDAHLSLRRLLPGRVCRARLHIRPPQNLQVEAQLHFFTGLRTTRAGFTNGAGSSHPWPQRPQ